MLGGFDRISFRCNCHRCLPLMCNNHGEISRFTLWSSTAGWPKHNCGSWRKSFLRFGNDWFLRRMLSEMFLWGVRTSLRLNFSWKKERKKKISELTSIMCLKAFVLSAVERLMWRRIFGRRPNVKLLTPFVILFS